MSLIVITRAPDAARCMAHQVSSVVGGAHDADLTCNVQEVSTHVMYSAGGHAVGTGSNVDVMWHNSAVGERGTFP
jgi:hypothetical protein